MFDTVIDEILAVSVVPLQLATMLVDHAMLTQVTAGVNTTVPPPAGSVGSAQTGGAAWKSAHVSGRSAFHGIVADGKSAAIAESPAAEISKTQTAIDARPNRLVCVMSARILLDLL